MRRRKFFFSIVILILVFSIFTAHALLSHTFIISGVTEIKNNTWDIHFENVKVKESSAVVSVQPTLDNDSLSLDFNVSLNEPGDYYEFTVEVHNDGTIDAMLDSFVFTPELTEAQKKYLTFEIKYQNGEPLESKQLLSIGEAVNIKIRLEYKKDLQKEDLPTTKESLNLKFDLNYVQADDEIKNVLDNGFINVVVDGYLGGIGTDVTIGTEQFDVIGIDGDNVKLIAKYNLFVGSSLISGEGTFVPYGDTATGMQDSRMLGGHPDFSIYHGIADFSNSLQHGTSYYDYEGSLAEVYVNNYASKLKGKFDLDIVEARLLTRAEVNSGNILYCRTTGNMPYCSSGVIGLTSFYCSHTKGQYSNLLVISANGEYYSGNSYLGESSLAGIRPVIVVPKSWFDDYVENNLIQFYVDGYPYQAEEGMTWQDFIDSEYNTDGFEEYDNPTAVVADYACISYESWDYVSFGDFIEENYYYNRDGSCINVQ